VDDCVLLEHVCYVRPMHLIAMHQGDQLGADAFNCYASRRSPVGRCIQLICIKAITCRPMRSIAMQAQAANCTESVHFCVCVLRATYKFTTENVHLLHVQGVGVSAQCGVTQ
jgi:hypothetical protein